MPCSASATSDPPSTATKSLESPSPKVAEPVLVSTLAPLTVMSTLGAVLIGSSKSLMTFTRERYVLVKVQVVV